MKGLLVSGLSLLETSRTSTDGGKDESKKESVLLMHTVENNAAERAVKQKGLRRGGPSVLITHAIDSGTN